MSRLGLLLARLRGRERLPAGFDGELTAGERVLAAGVVADGGHLVVTTLGAWIPDGAQQHRRVGWQWVSKASWDRNTLVITEAEQAGTAGDAVLLADRPARRFPLTEPGRVPEAVRERVTSSIRTSQRRELPGGGAWFVQRKLPGSGAVVLQVRPEPGADDAAVRALAAGVAERMRQLREQD